jgi:hypothetical protein
MRTASLWTRRRVEIPRDHPAVPTLCQNSYVSAWRVAGSQGPASFFSEGVRALTRLSGTSGMDLVHQIRDNHKRAWCERAEREIFRNTAFTTRSHRARWNWNAAELAEPVR